jgi:RNA polymerase sigma factor (sigma-70 family)
VGGGLPGKTPAPVMRLVAREEYVGDAGVNRFQMSQLRAHGWLGRQDDARLAALVGRGDAAAFEALYDRHHASLLAFCRHMLGNREDGEEALQQTFLRAHRALSDGRPPRAVRAWLFAIARNRCLTMLAARRDAAIPMELPESGYDDLAENVRRRAELRELVGDLRRLPEDQRAALVLSELGDLSHSEIGAVLGCPPKKVKALAFQAREALVADRDARCIPCAQIRGLLETATGGVLRRASLRRHLKQCAPCDAYRTVVCGGRRGGLGALLPVVPTAGLKAAVLGGAGAETASAAVGTAAVGGSSAAVTGITLKAVAAKVAVTAAVAGAGVSGGLAVVHDPVPAPRQAAAQTARPTPTPETPRTARPARTAPRRTTPATTAPAFARPSAPRRRAARIRQRRARARPARFQQRRARAILTRGRQRRAISTRARRAHRRRAAARPLAVRRRRAAAGPSPQAIRRRVRARLRQRGVIPRPTPAPTAAPTPSPTPQATPTPEATPSTSAQAEPTP